jgi:hypothetical protein
MVIPYNCHLMLTLMIQKILTYLTPYPIFLGMSIPFVYDHQHALLCTLLLAIHFIHILCFIKPASTAMSLCCIQTFIPVVH